jgi:ATP-dependent Clp protease protease subunit
MAGLLMYDIIQSARNTINMYCIGQAYSMAAILLASGPKGHRFILPHSKVMIHEPLISNGIGGSATNIKSISDSILETKSLIIELLKKHVTVDRSFIEEAIAFDNFMKPNEAITFGICDKVVQSIY